MNNLSICITSHVGNTIAVDKLVSSLQLTQFNILVVVGNNPENKVFHVNNIHYVYVTHNSIDFTGLVYICETQNLPITKPKYWLYLHDTCECNIEVFNSWCNNILTYYDGDTIPLTKYPSMNMGIYKHADLMKLKSDILKHKSSSLPSIDEIQKLKTRCVHNEDWIFKKLRCHDHCSARQTSHPTDVYGTCVKRITEYFPSVGIYKYKANWFVKRVYELGV